MVNSHSYSQGNRKVMEALCKHLTCLFCIGLIAFMGYTAIIGDDEEEAVKEWSEKMGQVQERMQEVLGKCK